MRTVISGSASGIGAAIRRRCERDGDRVLGLDLRDAEITADLATPSGREEALRAARERFPEGFDRLVACAGVGPQTEPPSRIASVNYFGAVALLDGLFDGLRRGTRPAAVAIGSNSSQMAPLEEDAFVLALLDGDEPRAARLMDEQQNAVLAYMGSKNALGRAVRRRARAWGAAGVRLNAVAPGPVTTPLLEQSLRDPRTAAAVGAVEIPLGRRGEPDEVAALVAFLLGDEASWIHGSVVFIDGGNDATLRPDRF